MEDLFGIGIILFWLIGSIVAGTCGSERECGFFAPFLLAVFCSPIIGFLYVICSERKDDHIYKHNIDKSLKLLVEDKLKKKVDE